MNRVKNIGRYTPPKGSSRERIQQLQHELRAQTQLRQAAEYHVKRYEDGIRELKSELRAVHASLHSANAELARLTDIYEGRFFSSTQTEMEANIFLQVKQFRALDPDPHEGLMNKAAPVVAKAVEMELRRAMRMLHDIYPALVFEATINWSVSQSES